MKTTITPTADAVKPLRSELEDCPALQQSSLAVHLKRVLDRIERQHQDERADWTEDDCECYNQARAALSLCQTQ